MPEGAQLVQGTYPGSTSSLGKRLSSRHKECIHKVHPACCGLFDFGRTHRLQLCRTQKAFQKCVNSTEFNHILQGSHLAGDRKWHFRSQLLHRFCNLHVTVWNYSGSRQQYKIIQNSEQASTKYEFRFLHVASTVLAEEYAERLFSPLRICGLLKVWLDGLVLRIKIAHIDDEVLHHKHMRQGCNPAISQSWSLNLNINELLTPRTTVLSHGYVKNVMCYLAGLNLSNAVETKVRSLCIRWRTETCRVDNCSGSQTKNSLCMIGLKTLEALMATNKRLSSHVHMLPMQHAQEQERVEHKVQNRRAEGITYFDAFAGSLSTFVRQASPFTPLIFIAQLPQIPSLQQKESRHISRNTANQAGYPIATLTALLKIKTRGLPSQYWQACCAGFLPGCWAMKIIASHNTDRIATRWAW